MLSREEVICVDQRWWSWRCSQWGGLVGKLVVVVLMLVSLRPRPAGFDVGIVGFG